MDKRHTPLSVQRRNVFLLDGRPLDKVKDFRFRESKFKMKIFDPLEEVDRKYRFAPPDFKHWAKLRDQEALRLGLEREVSEARLHAGLDAYSRSCFDSIEDASTIEHCPPHLTPTARPNFAVPQRSERHIVHKNAVWYGLTKPVHSSFASLPS
ncbi:Hypothetical Protein FCC1311_044682 [Hondaea fermentalgiana]|uniref:Uncharacterized protein n=1 Tax=Hondaea fermentalgiana TaxID=2315210 RepID=A0A2R5GCG3_9STRA|nr:Hypothetical Protein FCC1311_044682 [Hondaea fermentalgiana]|eukprot:GBG28245.1 Hypothetical Protein FCC1311_044682 [Hondaea fermentalgiana]